MPSVKIAITIPEEIVTAVDLAAGRRHESRSGFISRILRVAIRERRDAQITARLNELFADEKVGAEQLRLMRQLDSTGTDWSDEVW
jgi:hypothetical protein